MNDDCGGVDHGGETGVGFVAAHRDALELLEFGEKILDEMPPFIDFQVDIKRRFALRHLRDDDLGAALVELFDDPIGVESLVGEQGIEVAFLDEWRDADGIMAVSWQELEVDQIAKGVGQRQDLGRPSALRLAYGLALSPPFAPCPWRWTGTIVPSIMAYSISGSPETASNMRLKTSALTQCRKRLKAVFQLPNTSGKSRQGLLVRAIHSTASKNNRPSPPVRPGSLGLPRQCGSIFAHWASLRQNRIIDTLPKRSLNQIRAFWGILNLNRP